MGTPSPFPPFFNPYFNDDQSSFSNRREPRYELNNKIMLTAIISLSFVIVLVIILHVYARCALRRHAARRRAAIRHLGLTTASQAHSAEPPKTGLDPLVIAALPIFVYKQIQLDVDQDVGSNNSAECAVCLSFLEDQEMARLLPNCKHTFHAECIDKWLSSRSTCPICRTEVEPRQIEPLPREGPVGSSSEEAPILMCVVEGSTSSDPGNNQSSSSKLRGGSSSRLSSFRRMLSRERSSKIIQYEVQGEVFRDLERQ